MVSEKKNQLLRYGICFALVAMLCWFFPYTGDDWAWGSQIGIDRLKMWFANYNGRYLGNLCVLIMTRSNLIKAGIMALCLTGIPVLMEKMTGKKYAFYVGSMMLIFMPKLVFRQAVVWTAGFSNYVTSTFLTMIFLAYVYPIFESKVFKEKKWHCVPFLLLGAANGLFVEHMTLYNVAVSIAIVGYCLLIHKKLYVTFLAYVIGSLAGTIYMFSNGAYHSIANQEDTYRQMAAGGIFTRAFTNYKDIIAENLVINNLGINVCIFIVCMILWYQCFGKQAAKSKMYLAAKVSMAIIAVFNGWAILSSMGLAIYAKQNRLLYVEMLLASMYMIALLIYAVLIGYMQGKVWKMLFWNLSIWCVAAPLFVVNPVGERCFFITYVFFIMLFLELLAAMKIECIVLFLHGNMFRNFCAGAAIVGMAFYINIFSSVYQRDQERLAHVQEQVENGATSAELLYLPYESYLWTATPTAEPWLERYKLFYGLPADLELKAVWVYTE